MDIKIVHNNKKLVDIDTSDRILGKLCDVLVDDKKVSGANIVGILIKPMEPIEVLVGWSNLYFTAQEPFYNLTSTVTGVSCANEQEINEVVQTAIRNSNSAEDIESAARVLISRILENTKAVLEGMDKELELTKIEE